MESRILIVKRARNGKGLFVKKNFKSKQKIFEIKGKLVHESKLMDLDKKTRYNTFRFDGKFYLTPKGEFGDYLNHSCNPNCGIKKEGKKLFAIAIKNIKSGEEIVMDYSTIIADDDYWLMRCKCGYKKCRRKIGKFSKLSKNKKENYIKKRIVPKFILNTRK